MGLCLTLLAGCGKAETKEAAAPTPEPTVTEAPTVTPTETPTPEPTAEATPEPTEEPLAADTLAEGMVYSYLTGQPIEEAKGRRRPAAVMLNNIITACPQTGISRAGVIYEAPVEGGITRLMGIFEDYDDLEKIGSVRSCREYYVFLDTGFDAVYYHYGQAHYAVPYLESDNIDNVNGMNGYSDVYYRTSDRKPPHNAYTSGEGIKRGMEIIGCRTSYREDYEGFFQFAKESEPVILENGTTANKVTPGGYQHNKPWFEYDASTGTYLRYQFGEPQIDDMNNEQLAAKNILIQFCSWSKYSDDESYLNIDVQSGGTGKYITNGKAIDVTWSKNDEWGITYFYDTDGNRITMNPGKTWILLVQDNFIDSTVIE